MTPQETAQACMALDRWFLSQGISSEDAIGVLTLTLAGMIYDVAKKKNLDHIEGGRAAGRGLVAALKLAK